MLLINNIIERLLKILSCEHVTFFSLKQFASSIETHDLKDLILYSKDFNYFIISQTIIIVCSQLSQKITEIKNFRYQLLLLSFTYSRQNTAIEIDRWHYIRSRHLSFCAAYNIFNFLNNCNIRCSHQLYLFINAFRFLPCLKTTVFLMFLFFASFNNLFTVVFAYVYKITNSRDSIYSAVVISVFILIISWQFYV